MNAEVTPRTGNVLVQMGVITLAQLDITLAQQKALYSTGKRQHIGELLVRNQFARRDQVASAVEQLTAGGKVGGYQELLTAEVCAQYQVVASRTEGGVLYVMTARALRPLEITALISACAVPVTGVRQIAVSKQAMAERLARLSTSDVGFTAAVHKMQQSDTGAALREAVDILLQEALEMRASEIHLDRKGDPDCWVSYRVDGNLRQKHLVTSRVMGAIVTRIKTEGGMDASNNISPQDGRISLEYKGRIIDFRVNSQPIVDGETVALRVLDSEALPTTASMFPNQLAMHEMFESISKSNGKRGGIFLATGPTGSGKTTTLYALAKMLSRDSQNVMTVEDPVEYRLPFSRQIQLNQLLGQSAGDFERSLLRQDPDIIILGEIRTRDTAEAALRFAESGHMVLATLHADSVIGIFERMAGFFDGAQKEEALYVLGAQLRCAINQQLVPRLCSCSTHADRRTQDEHAVRLGIQVFAITKNRNGCPKCNNDIHGRVLAHETLIIPRDRAVRQQIHGILNAGISNANQIAEIVGVNYIARHDVVIRLLECGAIDFQEAENILAG